MSTRRLAAAAAAAVAVVLVTGIAFGEDGPPPTTVEMEIVAPSCPLARDGDDTTWLLRAEDGVLPDTLARGDRLRLTGQEVLSQPWVRDEECRDFAKIFVVEEAVSLSRPKRHSHGEAEDR